jgi:Xaa-Pro aminopeptidase
MLFGESMETRAKITELRNLMREFHIDAWIVPTADPHQSEYVADCWKARAWLSGFSGSAGTVVVTQEKAGLWVDPRYHIRAEKELEGSGIEPFKLGLPGVPPYPEWLAHEMKAGAVVGFDGGLMSVAEIANLSSLFQLKAIKFSYELDLIGYIWKERPEIPRNPIFLYAMEFAGESRESKIQRIRARLIEQQAQAHLITALDDIAWTLNIRGSDVKYNPVAIAYLVITLQNVHLFIHHDKIPNQVQEILEHDGVMFAEYEDIISYLRQIPRETIVLIDPEKTSYKLEKIISQTCQVKGGKSIPFILKAVKNEIELDGFRKAHIRDGAAMIKWMYWLEHQSLQTAQTEITLAEKLTEFRRQGQYFQGLSFGTIAGYRANAAIGHYSPQIETTPAIKPEGLLLIDSGAQYLDGTTDITRTLTLGSPTAEEKRAFTLVLKSHIRLARAKFPRGTKGDQLDVLGREILWQQGWNCRHGIGHGVGHFLNVHEGPLRFSQDNLIMIEPGMVTSNEPGVYFENRFGIRIENMVIIIPVDTTEFGEFYGFETITLCPIDLDLIETTLLTEPDKDWLNEYHQHVYKTLAPFLDQEERQWLSHKTREI